MKNKNKSLKIVLGIIITLIVLVIGFIILIVTEVIPNPFLDTKDLVCEITIGDPTAGPQAKTIFIFKFDKQAIITSYNEKAVQYFLSNDEAKNEYNNIKSNNESANIELNENSIIYSIDYSLEVDKGYYGKSKKEIKKIFIDEYSYECK